MTNAELIEKLLARADEINLVNRNEETATVRLLRQAADALETQAKEIADLQQRNVERALEIDKIRLVISKLIISKLKVGRP